MGGGLLQLWLPVRDVGGQQGGGGQLAGAHTLHSNGVKRQRVGTATQLVNGGQLAGGAPGYRMKRRVWTRKERKEKSASEIPQHMHVHVRTHTHTHTHTHAHIEQ